MNERNIRQEFLHYAFKGTKKQLSGGASMYDFEDQVVFRQPIEDELKEVIGK